MGLYLEINAVHIGNLDPKQWGLEDNITNTVKMG
jgi:hypothetical protein